MRWHRKNGGPAGQRRQEPERRSCVGSMWLFSRASTHGAELNRICPRDRKQSCVLPSGRSPPCRHRLDGAPRPRRRHQSWQASKSTNSSIHQRPLKKSTDGSGGCSKGPESLGKSAGTLPSPSVERHDPAAFHLLGELRRSPKASRSSTPPGRRLRSSISRTRPAAG